MAPEAEPQLRSRRAFIERRLLRQGYGVDWFGEIYQINERGVPVGLAHFVEEGEVKIMYSLVSADCLAGQNELAKYLLSIGVIKPREIACASGWEPIEECAQSLTEVLGRNKTR